jgi:ABC-type transport system involved in cytochrome c biogenesis permease subunit
MGAEQTALFAILYAAMALWAASLTAHLLRRAGAGRLLFGLGGCLLVAVVPVRWWQVGHPPMQSMFEVFLCLGALLWPLWAFCRRFLEVRGPAVAVALGMALLVPPAFVFSPDPQLLPPALRSPLFVPHVAAYVLGYVVMALAAAQAALQLGRRRAGDAKGAAELERATYRMVRLGFPMLTLGLLLGSVWGHRAWGSYWNWDPKELWSLATWLVYVAYLHWRRLHGTRSPRVNALLALAGTAAIALTLVWVNLAARLFGGLHTYAAP